MKICTNIPSESDSVEPQKPTVEIYVQIFSVVATDEWLQRLISVLCTSVPCKFDLWNVISMQISRHAPKWIFHGWIHQIEIEFWSIKVAYVALAQFHLVSYWIVSTPNVFACCSTNDWPEKPPWKHRVCHYASTAEYTTGFSFVKRSTKGSFTENSPKLCYLLLKAFSASKFWIGWSWSTQFEWTDFISK